MKSDTDCRIRVKTKCRPSQSVHWIFFSFWSFVFPGCGKLCKGPQWFRWVFRIVLRHILVCLVCVSTRPDLSPLRVWDILQFWLCSNWRGTRVGFVRYIRNGWTMGKCAWERKREINWLFKFILAVHIWKQSGCVCLCPAVCIHAPILLFLWSFTHKCPLSSCVSVCEREVDECPPPSSLILMTIHLWRREGDGTLQRF